MHFLSAKCAKNAFVAGALPWTPLGQFAALPHALYLDLRGLLRRRES